MNVKKFFSQSELLTLIKCVIDNYNPTDLKNTINLACAGELIQKISDHFESEYGVRVKFIQSFIFLASSTTMSSKATSADQGWHTDGTCQIIDGDCYNAWIPVYNDSTCTGIEVIPESENKDLYAALGDATDPPVVYVRDTAPWVFDIMKGRIASNADMIFVKSYNGTILPVCKKDLHIVRCEDPQPGDISIFKQSEIHRGFHKNGIRIQLSLKFQAIDARLNSNPSNNLYKLFEAFAKGNGGYDEYMEFTKLFTPKTPLSKHGILERDAILSLLKNTCRELEREPNRLEKSEIL